MQKRACEHQAMLGTSCYGCRLVDGLVRLSVFKRTRKDSHLLTTRTQAATRHPKSKTYQDPRPEPVTSHATRLHSDSRCSHATPVHTTPMVSPIPAPSIFARPLHRQRGESPRESRGPRSIAPCATCAHPPAQSHILSHTPRTFIHGHTSRHRDIGFRPGSRMQTASYHMPSPRPSIGLGASRRSCRVFSSFRKRRAGGALLRKHATSGPRAQPSEIEVWPPGGA